MHTIFTLVPHGILNSMLVPGLLCRNCAISFVNAFVNPVSSIE